MVTPHEYASANQARFLDQLKDLIRIPSISAERATHEADMVRAAAWLADDMRSMGLHHVELIHEADHYPLVYGEWLGAGDAAPTVLVYGHYDVQPALKSDGWDTEPFEPVEQDGKLYARGASDDKGQMLLQLKAVESLLADGNTPPVNIKVLLEGEEEISSRGIQQYVPAHTDKLAADVCVISDTSILSKQQPSIVYALRGLVYMEMEVVGPATDLHSGTYGGTIHNPLQAISEIIAGLHNEDGSIAVPGFYDDVVHLSDEERAELKKTEKTPEQLLAMTGAPAPWGEPAYTITERTGARPTLEIHGIIGGHTGEGEKTVLPSKAKAKLSCRLVANQQPEQIYELVKARVEALAPPTVKVTVNMLSSGNPALIDIHNPAMRAATTAYERGFGKGPVYVRAGGSIPIVSVFQQALDLPVIMLGFGLPTDGLHGPNEHYHLDMFYKGVDTAIHFFQAVGEQLGKNND